MVRSLDSGGLQRPRGVCCPCSLALVGMFVAALGGLTAVVRRK